MNDKDHATSAPAADRNDPKWLALPEAKKAVALRRASVFDNYHGLARHSQEDLISALAELGLGRTRFYSLMKMWKRDRRLLDLVPHAEPRTRAPHPAADAADSIVSHLVHGEEDAPATPRSAFSLNMKSGEGVVADRFGEYLVIDHTHPDLFVTVGEERIRPELTLVIDLLTTTVLGAHLHVGGPTPEAVARALVDAVGWSERLAPEAQTIAPTILLPTDWDPRWVELARRIGAAGGVASPRRSAKLHRGHVTRRLIGGRLDTVKLLSRRPRHDFRTARPVDAQHCVLTLDEARIVLDAAIRSRNSRLIDGAWPSRLALDPTALPT